MESDESEQSSAEETGNSTSDQLNTDSKKKPGTSNSKVNSQWTAESLNQLIHQVLLQTDPGDNVPYTVQKIDWEKVSVSSQTPSSCKEKWDELLTMVRHYRTLFEVASDMFGIIGRKPKGHIAGWNKRFQKEQRKEIQASQSPSAKKKLVNPDYPKKPRSSAYAVFSVQMLTEMKSSDLHGQKLMVEVGKAWSNLSEDRKQAFRDRWQKEKDSYLEELQRYSREHADDEKIKELIKEEKEKVKKKKRSPKNPKITNFLNSDKKTPQKQKPETQVDEEESADNTDKSGEKTAATLKSPNKSKTVVKNPTADSHENTPKKSSKKNKQMHNLDHMDDLADSGMDTTTTAGIESPMKSPKKRVFKDEPGTAEESPKKKKHKHKHRLTGEILYYEQKREGYALEHPDLDPDIVKSKLKRKYEKMSEKKKAKYEQLAIEMNEQL